MPTLLDRAIRTKDQAFIDAAERVKEAGAKARQREIERYARDYNRLTHLRGVLGAAGTSFQDQPEPYRTKIIVDALAKRVRQSEVLLERRLILAITLYEVEGALLAEQREYARLTTKAAAE